MTYDRSIRRLNFKYVLVHSQQVGYKKENNNEDYIIDYYLFECENKY